MLRRHPGEVAGIIQAPNYALWAEQVNAKGGLMVKGGGRRPIEYVSFDDRSHLAVARLEPHGGPGERTIEGILHDAGDRARGGAGARGLTDQEEKRRHTDRLREIPLEAIRHSSPHGVSVI